MTYRGRVKNGVIVLESKSKLAEGTVVDVEPIQKPKETLGQKLLKHAGVAKGLPKDMAENHDHYLHGLPKK
jgi:hypothetical protein